MQQGADHRGEPTEDGAGKDTGIDAHGSVEVTPDQAHGFDRELTGIGDRAQAVVHEHDIGGGTGDVGTTWHGDADLGGNERRAVVDPVADEGDLTPGSLQVLDDGSLVLRGKFGIDPIQPELGPE